MQKAVIPAKAGILKGFVVIGFRIKPGMTKPLF
jgi:hypothetical protein